ncbi:hypothetical protein [Rhizobium sp. GCM10022189]|uniref:hypothetical protein n=1 Tax=Rhizobium sp. GCM10022189 TaxID=3252654 RepID=UPI003609CD8D
MAQYVIDMKTTATFRVTASSKKEALKALREVTRDLDLQIEVGHRTSIEFVNITCTEENPEVVGRY